MLVEKCKSSNETAWQGLQLCLRGHTYATSTTYLPQSGSETGDSKVGGIISDKPTGRYIVPSRLAANDCGYYKFGMLLCITAYM